MFISLHWSCSVSVPCWTSSYILLLGTGQRDARESSSNCRRFIHTVLNWIAMCSVSTTLRDMYEKSNIRYSIYESSSDLYTNWIDSSNQLSISKMPIYFFFAWDVLKSREEKTSLLRKKTWDGTSRRFRANVRFISCYVQLPNEPCNNNSSYKIINVRLKKSYSKCIEAI